MTTDAFVYILASKKNGTLYTGVTSDLSRRIAEHKSKSVPGFTSQYGVDRLVWYLAGDDIVAAIELEKKIKNRPRQWKIALIEKTNPDWRDLSEDFMNGSCDYAQDDLQVRARDDAKACARGEGSGGAQLPSRRSARSRRIWEAGARDDGSSPVPPPRHSARSRRIQTVSGEQSDTSRFEGEVVKYVEQDR